MAPYVAWGAKAHFGLGASPLRAARWPIRRLRGNADAASFHSAPAPHKRKKPARASPTPKTVSNSDPDDPGVSRAHRPSPFARSLS